MSTTANDICCVIEQVKLYLLEKNRQKENSPAKSIGIFSKTDNSEQLLIRIDDTLNQIAQRQALDNQGLILDLIGYLIMLVVLRTQVKQQEDEQKRSQSIDEQPILKT